MAFPDCKLIVQAMRWCDSPPTRRVGHRPRVVSVTAHASCRSPPTRRVGHRARVVSVTAPALCRSPRVVSVTARASCRATHRPRVVSAGRTAHISRIKITGGSPASIATCGSIESRWCTSPLSPWAPLHASAHHGARSSSPQVHLADIDARIALTPTPDGLLGTSQRPFTPKPVGGAPAHEAHAAQSEAPQPATVTRPPSYSASLQVRRYVMSTDEH